MLYLSSFARYSQNKKNIKFDLENEDQDQGVEELYLRHSTGIVEVHIGEFFRILDTWEHTFMQIDSIHTQRNGRT